MVDEFSDTQIENELFLWGEVTSENCFELYKQILIQEKNEQDFNLNICSVGGEVEPIYGIMDKIEQMIGQGYNINTVGIGSVYSAAAMLFITGKTRMSYRNTSFMFHPYFYSLPENDHYSHKTYVDFMEKFYLKFMSELCEQIGLSKRKAKSFIEKCKTELWLNAEDAYELGIVHQIIE